MSKKAQPLCDKTGKFIAKANPPSSLAMPAPASRKTSQTLASSSVLTVADEPTSPHISITSEIPGSFPSLAAPSPAHPRSLSLASAQPITCSAQFSARSVSFHTHPAPPPSVANPVLPSTDPVVPPSDPIDLPADLVEPLADIIEPLADIIEPLADIIEPLADIVEPPADLIEPLADLVEPLADII